MCVSFGFQISREFEQPLNSQIVSQTTGNEPRGNSALAQPIEFSRHPDLSAPAAVMAGMRLCRERVNPFRETAQCFDAFTGGQPDGGGTNGKQRRRLSRKPVRRLSKKSRRSRAAGTRCDQRDRTREFQARGERLAAYGTASKTCDEKALLAVAGNGRVATTVFPASHQLPALRPLSPLHGSRIHPKRRRPGEGFSPSFVRDESCSAKRHHRCWESSRRRRDAPAARSFCRMPLIRVTNDRHR